MDLQQPSATASHATVTGLLAADHASLTAILRDVTRMVDDGELERAEHVFADYRDGLLRHIRLEEELLFPRFEALSGLRAGGPTRVMRIEHLQIREGLAQLERALAHGNAPAYREALDAYLELMAAHDQKEERVLYPAIDSLLPPDQRAGFVRQLERFR